MLGGNKMFKEDTVFVLGAGASWHYGYPTGENLVKKVIEKSDDFVERLEKYAREGKCPHQVSSYLMLRGVDTFNKIKIYAGIYKQLSERLRYTNTLVIDDFLSYQSAEIQEAGKFIIAWVILECERGYIQGVNNGKDNNYNGNRIGNPYSHNDDWCRFLIHKLVSGCPKFSLAKNKVSFITFNYDVSLEQRLIRAFQGMTDYFHPDEIKEFLSSDRITHVYGQVRTSFSSGFEGIITNYDGRNFPDFSEIEKAAKSIYTIENLNAGEVDECESYFQIARQKIDLAKNVYILGYGFDSRNSERIGLDQLKNSLGVMRRIYITNKDDKNTVNKSANQQIVDGSYEGHFVEKHIFYAPDEYIGNYYEKSARPVYEALSEDFGLL